MVGLHEQLETALSGRYQIERELGHGGMAVVYLARDLKHSRRVAVKVLRPELATSVGAERFLREINVAAGLSHPNIVPLYDSGEADDLLYYVMPYVEGESLRDRLERERQLPIDDAVAIARQVAVALDYAHAKGVVHRDIKPENILLRDGQVLVADFGLACALYTASSARLTKSGMAVGTPAYMSPEQASGDTHVDGRADVYALGCVLFEIIAGVPPFPAASAQAVLAHHVTTPAPSLCRERPSCPSAIDAAVKRAMAKVPADRFRTAGQFVDALRPTVNRALGKESDASERARSRRRLAALAMLVAAVSATTALIVRGLRVELNAARYVVLPFSSPSQAGLEEAQAAASRLIDALSLWDGIELTDPTRVRQALAARGPRALQTTDPWDIARDLGAGNVVSGDVQLRRDSVVVTAVIYDVAGRRPLRRHTIGYSSSSARMAQSFRELGSVLLRGHGELPWARPEDRRPASLQAWLTYDSARVALSKWNLADAVNRLRSAVTHDPDHAQAQLWLAQALAWHFPDRAEEWRPPATRAVAMIDRLSGTDASLARGLYALATDQYPAACEAFKSLRDASPRSAVGWFGLGQCQTMDPIVVRDARSPSGWRFRGSYKAAVTAYETGLRLADGVPEFAYWQLGRLLFIETFRYRSGRSISPDTFSFAAYPGLVADTLAFVPYRAGEFASGSPRTIPSSLARALRRNALDLARQFSDWTRRSPTSVDALERLAHVQEVLGDRNTDGGLTALETLSRARKLAADPARQLIHATTATQLLVKSEQFARARKLADSIIRANPRANGTNAERLAALAALGGRADRTAEYLRVLAVTSPTQLFSSSEFRPPDVVATAGATYLAYAALGGCSPHLRAAEQELDRLLQRHVPVASRQVARQSVASRAASLSVPCAGFTTLSSIGSPQGRLAKMQLAFAVGRRDVVRAHFDTLRASRRADLPGSIALDHTFQEAWLLAAMGDTAAAVAHLDLPLTALSTLSSRLLRDVPQSAALARATQLRAELATAVGDVVAARQWARATMDLLDTGAVESKGTLSPMKSLAEGRGFVALIVASNPTTPRRSP